MTNKARKQFKHVCPRNCYSNCTLISTVENGRIAELNGNSNHPYTKGKLCAKGFASIEMNEHRERLKFPYYQEVKGSGKFRKITWEKAYELIISEMMSTHEKYGNLLPVGYFKGTGNLGVHHFVTEQFFSSIGGTTRILDSFSSLASFEAMGGKVERAEDPLKIKEASMIIIWGANPAATNVHLTPFIIEAKVKGAKIVVIDPLDTQTAELADLYIQIRPGTDGILAHLLIKGLVEAGVPLDELASFESSMDSGLLEETASFVEWVRNIDNEDALLKLGVSGEAIELLLEWYKDTGAVAHVIGNGLLRHGNAGHNIQGIRSLAAIHGDTGRDGGGIFIRQGAVKIFNNQLSSDGSSFRGRLLDLNNLKERVHPSTVEPPLQMLWISCANPLTQAPNTQFWTEFLKDIPLVVTVGHFLTPTANMSNLVLPTTTHFEEWDIVVNNWHKGMAANEKAVAPYHESRSEWNIMKEIALRLEKALPCVCSFPVHSSEEEYLDAQFNDRVYEQYGVRRFSDLRRRMGPVFPVKSQEGELSQLSSGKFGNEIKRNNKGAVGHNSALEKKWLLEKKSPTKEYPFWLITPHHPYRLNSQFHFLNLSDEKEAYVGINEEAAKKLGIFNGEVVRVFNDRDSIEIKAIYSIQVPEDIVFIYEGWYPDCDVDVNRLISCAGTVTDEEGPSMSGALYNNTFVKVEKL